MQLLINEFTDNLVEFKAHRILNAKTLWINSKQLNARDGMDFTADNFANTYAYAIKSNEFFEDIIFDESEQKIVTAERYGGQGVGTNGGGARCGNHIDFQVKGIGKNPLALNMGDHWHSYGGLNLVDAIYETINAAVFAKILPVGVANIYGIIITGKNTALLPGDPAKDMQEKRSYGALLVREICVRPAHFFRSAFFDKKNNDSLGFLSDVARVRNVNQNLAIKFGETKAFIGQIGKYLANYANQFAFARAARISHGSISPSNMCLDGRWLDLTNTSFLDGGRNVCGSVPFYSEPDAIMGMLEELIYTFSKYNKLSLNPSALMKYYVEQFNGYFKVHVSYVIGILYSRVDGGIANPDYRFVSNIFWAVISSAKNITAQRAYEYKNSDPVICLIEGLYISVVSVESAAKKFENCLDNSEHIRAVSGAFLKVMENVYGNIKNPLLTFRNFILSSAIISIKRSLVAEYFYMGRLENHIYEMVKDKKEELFVGVIENSIGVADWAFNLKEGLDVYSGSAEVDLLNIVIFKSEYLRICFDPGVGLYELSDISLSEKINFDNLQDLLLSVRSNNIPTTISNYCFLKYLDRLAESTKFLDKI